MLDAVAGTLRFPVAAHACLPSMNGYSAARPAKPGSRGRRRRACCGCCIQLRAWGAAGTSRPEATSAGVDAVGDDGDHGGGEPDQHRDTGAGLMRCDGGPFTRVSPNPGPSARRATSDRLLGERVPAAARWSGGPASDGEAACGIAADRQILGWPSTMAAPCPTAGRGAPTRPTCMVIHTPARCTGPPHGCCSSPTPTRPARGPAEVLPSGSRNHVPAGTDVRAGSTVLNRDGCSSSASTVATADPSTIWMRAAAPQDQDWASELKSRPANAAGT